MTLGKTSLVPFSSCVWAMWWSTLDFVLIPRIHLGLIKKAFIYYYCSRILNNLKVTTLPVHL